MEELKILVDMVAHLPTMAVWVLCGYLVYKVAVVGSIYGVIHFGLAQLFGWLKTNKAREVEYKELRVMLDGVCIRAAIEPLMAQLHRLRGKAVSIDSSYIHDSSVEWLREAIDAKIALEKAK
jgi:uncharacterized membrane protein YhiD involved in acid resistance